MEGVCRSVCCAGEIGSRTYHCCTSQISESLRTSESGKAKDWNQPWRCRGDQRRRTGHQGDFDVECQSDHRRNATSQHDAGIIAFLRRSIGSARTCSQAAQNRRSDRHARCPNGIRKKSQGLGAFWWGQLGATIWCPSGVPGTTATTAPVQVQSWLHSIIDEWNYKPTWAAEAEALKLAFEVGCTSFDHADVDSDNYYKRYLGLVGDLPQSTMTQGSILKISGAQNYADSPSLKFPQLVHFANEVEIAFSGRPGSPLIQSKMSEFGFSSWRNKPWAYRPTQSSVEVSHFLAANFDEIANRVLQSSAILPLSHLLPVQHRITDHHNAGPLSDRINDLPQLPFGILPAHGQFDQLPTFAQQILARTDETIIPFQNDWDLGVTTRTWFLHHFNEPRCDVGESPLQFIA